MPGDQSNVVIYYKQVLSCSNWVNMRRRGLVSLERIEGPNSINALRTVNNLATLLHQQGKIEEAKLLYERALAGYENNEALGPEHPLSIHSINGSSVRYMLT